MGFSRQEYWSGLPLPSPWVFLPQGLNLCLLHWQADSLPLIYCVVCVCVFVCVCVCKGGRQGEGEREREKRRVGRNKIVLKSNYSLTYKWKACFVIQELLLARTGHVSFIISTNCLCLLEYPISTHSRQCLYFNHLCC